MSIKLKLGGATFAALLALPIAASAQLMIIANDEKATWNDAGVLQWGAPGKDTVLIVDISKPLAPKIVVSLPLINTVVGPPTNLAITPDASLALVANSMNVTQDGGAWKPSPDTKIHLIDLKAKPPAAIGSVEVGKQPSGMAISMKGDMALVAHRADNAVGVLSIKGKEVKLVDTVKVSADNAPNEQVSAVAITPDGKWALAAKFAANKVAVLAIGTDGKVTYTKQDITVGVWPYNVQIAPSGKIALTADNGFAGGSDGNVDTVTVIDLEASPPRAIDKVVVGDAPEGLVISPKGDVAAAILLNGSAGVPKGVWYANPAGKVAILKIDGKKVRKIKEIEVGGLPEGAVFSPDGKYLYVGNFTTSDVSILAINGTTVTNTGKMLKLSGHPAAMRGTSP